MSGDAGRARADAIVAALQRVADVRSRSMMGGRLIYVDEVLVGQVNEGELFVKRSDFTAGYAADLEQRPPYAGAKPAIVVPFDRLDDDAWLHGLLAGAVTAQRASTRPRSARRPS